MPDGWCQLTVATIDSACRTSDKESVLRGLPGDVHGGGQPGCWSSSVHSLLSQREIDFKNN